VACAVAQLCWVGRLLAWPGFFDRGDLDGEEREKGGERSGD
jgi:hypothetical protein